MPSIRDGPRGSSGLCTVAGAAVDLTDADRTWSAPLGTSAPGGPVVHVRPDRPCGGGQNAAHGASALLGAPALLWCCARPRRDVQGGTRMNSRQNDDLVVALRHAARQMAGQRSIRDLEETLGQIVTSAVATIPRVDAGSISITEHGQIETRHPTTEAIGKLDRAQSELYEGPCISAIDDPPESGIVIAEDFTGGDDAERWPRFAPRAVEAGYRGLMSTQLSTEGGPRAALNLY